MKFVLAAGGAVSIGILLAFIFSRDSAASTGKQPDAPTLGAGVEPPGVSLSVSAPSPATVSPTAPAPTSDATPTPPAAPSPAPAAPEPPPAAPTVDPREAQIAAIEAKFGPGTSLREGILRGYARQPMKGGWFASVPASTFKGAINGLTGEKFTYDGPTTGAVPTLDEWAQLDAIRRQL